MKPKDTERIGQLVSYGYVLAVSAFLLVPFMVTVIRSVTYNLPDGTTTVGLKPYFDIMESFWPKVYLSLSIAVTTILIDTAVGIPAAYALVRYVFPGKRALYTLLNGVWYVPGICYALSLILAYYFLYSKWALGYWGFIAAYSAGFLLLMLMTCIVAFKYVDPCYEESASCLGAGRLTTFFKVTMPLIGPGVSAGILLIFVLSFNEFITALLLNLPTKLMTAPVRVFAEITRARATPYIAAEAAVLQLISLAVVIVYLRLVGTKYLRGVILV